MPSRPSGSARLCLSCASCMPGTLMSCGMALSEHRSVQDAATFWSARTQMGPAMGRIYWVITRTGLPSLANEFTRPSSHQDAITTEQIQAPTARELGSKLTRLGCPTPSSSERGLIWTWREAQWEGIGLRIELLPLEPLFSRSGGLPPWFSFPRLVTCGRHSCTICP